MNCWRAKAQQCRSFLRMFTNLLIHPNPQTIWISITTPCLVMEPAYANVGDRMTIYIFDSMIFRLNLARSAEALQKLTGKYKICIIEFDLMWQGLNHTVTGVGRESNDQLRYRDVQLLLYRPGWNYS